MPGSEAKSATIAGRMLRPWPHLPRRFRFASDPYLLYTAALAPIVIAIALLARRPGEVVVALGLSATAIVVQLLLGRRSTAGLRRHARTTWEMVRIAVPLMYVAVAVQLIGGPALPLLALFVPVVAGAAAIGTVHAWSAAGLSALVYLGPELGNLGSPAAVVLRGVTLAGVAFLTALGTRQIIAALQEALKAARTAVIAERRRSRQIDALDAVSHLLATGGPTAELLDRVLEVIGSQFGYQYVSVYLGDENRVGLVARRGYVEALAAFDPSVGVAGRVMRSRQIALVPDVALEPDYVPGTITATSLICAPLVVDGAFLGLLNVETAGGRRLDHTDRLLVGLLATRLATAVALGRDRQALADRVKLFRAIGEFSTDIGASLAVGPLAQVIVDAAERVVEADVIVLTVLDRTSGRYEVRAIHGGDERAVGREVLPGEGLAGRAIRDRVIAVDEARVGDPPRSVRHLSMPRVEHGLGLPLVRDGVVVGAMTVGRTGEREPFSELEREGLSLVASHAALAVANAFLHAEMSELAVRDPLTGLYNRRHFDEALARMIDARRRDRVGGWRPLSAIVFDLDHFGAFNKQHGHQVGDMVLRAFGEVLRGRFRAADLVARIGGEEFVVIVDGADREGALSIADEVRATLAARRITTDDGNELHVTVSAGCAELDPSDMTHEALLRTADVALFMAKRAGRDRVVAA